MMTEKIKDILVGCAVAGICLAIGTTAGLFSERRVQTVKQAVLQERIDSLEQWNADAHIEKNEILNELELVQLLHDNAVFRGDSLTTVLGKTRKTLSLYKMWNNELCVTLRAITGDSRLADQYEAAVANYEQTIPIDED